MPHPAAPRRRARATAAALLLIGALLLPGFFVDRLAELEALSALRLHALAALAALLPLAALRLGRRGAIAAALLGALALGGLRPAWTPPAPATPGSPQLVALTANLKRTNTDFAGLERDLLAAGADILALQEVPPGFLARAAALRRAYPYGLEDLPLPPGAGTAVLSRFPTRAGEGFWGHRPGHAEIAAETPLGLLRVMSLQFARPDRRIRPLQRDSFPRLAPALQQDGAALILGDFNAPPWSPLVAAVAEAAGLRPAPGFRGSFRGLAPESLPSPLRGAAFGLPLDHLLLPPGLTATAAAPLPIAGADHMAVRFTIARRAP